MLPWLIGAVIAAVVVALLLGILFYKATRDPLKKAEELSDAGRFNEAIDVLRSHVSKRPNDADAWFELGKLQWRSNQFTNAAASFEEVLSRRPKDIHAAMMAVQCLATLGDRTARTRQIGILNRVTKEFPDNKSAQLLLALSQGANDDINGQVETLEEMVQRDPSNIEARKNLGIAFALRGNVEGAARELGMALETEPDSSDLQAARGFVACLQGETDAAVEALQAAADGGTSINAAVLTRLGALLVAEGRYEDAETYLRQAVTASRNNNLARFLHGLCLQALGQYEEARSTFEAISRDGGDHAAEAAVQAALGYIGHGGIPSPGDLTHARDMLDRAVQLGAKGAVLYTLRGRLEALSGDDGAAQEAFRRAIQADASYAAAHLENGLLYMRREMFTEGLRELERYLELADPDAEGSHTAEVDIVVRQLRQTLGGEEPASGVSGGAVGGAMS